MARKKQALPEEVFLVVANVSDSRSAHPVVYASWSKHYCGLYIKRSPDTDLGVVGPYRAAQVSSPVKMSECRACHDAEPGHCETHTKGSTK